jgi:ribosomal protein L16 Arg81 hydroxylase
MENEKTENFFSQSNICLQQSSSEITQDSINQLAEHMKSFIESPDFKQWFGKHITEPKTFLPPQEEEFCLSTKQLEQKLKSGEVLVPAAGLKRSWINSDEPMLFIEGEKIELPTTVSSEILAFICDSNEITIENISNFNKSSESMLQLLTLIYNKGYFVFEEEI